ncbi:D-alanyl-D-alanine carboxypeptidase [Streptosporangium subroseum]|uniref:D-alanyl-D-alanine carboxypeptidase n=1 Tax=Streptosporangium subroseum TaxID=106412 RepID=A0A239KWW4_9ACTN|nr:Clp protease N-terminal domain-containing protein [Streptosporangium subroseum]SNT21999.1 D-alanyl-D-alanine carboxypeptidase [Streptosporangium subroseum]
MAAIDEYINTIIERGRRDAHHDGSSTIEAHHLLLAIAAEGENATHQALTSAGLDHRAIRDALDREFEHSLNAAGVSLAASGLPRPSKAAKPPTQLGASAKLALERGFASVDRKKDLRPAHLLLGILQAQVGTVPRALALADVDRAELMARLLRTLTPESD